MVWGPSMMYGHDAKSTLNKLEYTGRGTIPSAITVMLVEIAQSASRYGVDSLSSLLPPSHGRRGRASSKFCGIKPAGQHRTPQSSRTDPDEALRPEQLATNLKAVNILT